MNSDKRKVSTDALETLGTIIDDSAGRDAIHLAVEPCIASEQLSPGQHVGIVDGKASTKADKKLGIVDPFISGYVPAGSKFWLVVYPRQITSLRHVWTHPGFDNKELTEKEKSEQWINEFADRIQQHPKALMAAADMWVYDEEYTYDNSENYKDHWEEFPEFWKHYEIVTGRKPKDLSSFFTCSC